MEGRWTIHVCHAHGQITGHAACRCSTHPLAFGVHPATATPVVPCDDVHAWLTRVRDTTEDRYHPAWVATDWLIGDWERRPTLAPEDDRAARETP